MNADNLLLLTDSYKLTHWRQYPPGTTNVYSYFESRGGEYPETVFFGLQYLLKRYLKGRVVTNDMIDEAEDYVGLHLGDRTLFNRQGWEHIVDAHDGALPVSIKAVPEGSVIPNHNVLMTIENTDPRVPWLTNYLETLLVETWYPCTVATLSRAIRQLILSFLDQTGNPDLVDFKLHDFGFRGVSSVESAGIGGGAHLVNFKGTDTVAAVKFLREYYNAPMGGFSIPAAEHSTITAWGREHEADAMENMLKQFPRGGVAVVSDSFDIFAACRDIWGKKLADRVTARDGVVVIRPDSGDPPVVILEVLKILGDAFGYAENDKGYKVLDEHVRIIQGDGVDYQSIKRILTDMKLLGWSADNIAFGMGGALLQRLHRDTQKFAFKCSSVEVDGVQRDVYKEPITDPGKNSKAGRLRLIKVEGEYLTTKTDRSDSGLLVEVFRDGRILKEYDLADIRHRVNP